jgi:hypothetical protein
MPAFAEAESWAGAQHVRQLFVSLLMYNTVADPAQLWNNHKDALSEDILYAARQQQPGRPQDEQLLQECHDEALRRIDDMLQALNSSLSNFKPLKRPADAPHQLNQQQHGNRLVREQLRAPHVMTALQRRVDEEMQNQLNVDQKAAVLAVMDAVRAGVMQGQPPHGYHSCPADVVNSFFLDSPGGCGKTFTLNHLLATVRAQGRIALSVASSGIAALLLDGGSTAHSRFKIPLEPNASSTCTIPAQSDSADLIRRAALINWDEAPMTHRYAFEALDRTLRVSSCKLTQLSVAQLSGSVLLSY